MIDDEGVDYDFLCKYIIIGDASVGKSNLLLRYIHGQFRKDHKVTVGVEFGAKSEIIEDKNYRIQIYDTAGQENFRSITRGYFRNSACALVVYDITRRDTFNSVKDWIEDCKNSSPKNILIVLVGNKLEF